MSTPTDESHDGPHGATRPHGRNHLSVANRCHATARSGKRCRNLAIAGGTVCRFHGGAAPQVRAKAQERLAALVDPAIERLSKIVQDDEAKALALAAARDILDRNNLSGKHKHEHVGGAGGPIITRIERVIVDPKVQDDVDLEAPDGLVSEAQDDAA